jgi:hypothetical protein
MSLVDTENHFDPGEPMKNGICPKCPSHEVYRHAGSQFAHEMITLKGNLISKGVAPDKYVCVGCGYLEYYLPLTDDLQLVRDHWEHVPTQ